MERYLPTGNEMISLPKLNEQTAAIEDLTFLSMQQRGMIELCGTENVPLMQPFIQIDQEELAFTGLQWSREHFWIPSGQIHRIDAGWRERVCDALVCHSANRLPLKTWRARSME